jgi:transcriptional antiterminator
MEHLDQLSDYKLLKEDLQLTGILQERVMIFFKVIYVVAEVNHGDLYRDSNAHLQNLCYRCANRLDFILTLLDVIKSSYGNFYDIIRNFVE